MTNPDYFASIAGSVNLSLMRRMHIVVVGIGTVGSQISHELARCGVGRFRLIDHDRLEPRNLARHVLPNNYLGRNKADALATYLNRQVQGIRAEAEPRRVDHALPDDELDQWLAGADLIVAATDDREAQRRIGTRALALGIPAVFPALYRDGGGEVMIQLDPRLPCFSCWDGFRPSHEQLRGVSAINTEALPIITLAVRLSLGILDPRSEHRHLLAREAGRPPQQLFVLDRSDRRQIARLTRRPGCRSCNVGPSPLNPDAVKAWEEAENRRLPTSSPPTHTPAIPQGRSAESERTPKALIVFACLAVALLIAIGSTDHGGQTSQSLPPEQQGDIRLASAGPNTPESAALVSHQRETEQAAAKARIARLSFKCTKPYICQLAIGGEQSLPLYIEGMDEHLQQYLSAHGYRDFWTDSEHTLQAQSIGPNEANRNTRTGATRFRYLASINTSRACDDCASVGSNLMLENNDLVSRSGLEPPQDIHSWTVFWQLKDEAGEVVKRLRFTVPVGNCEDSTDSDPTPCGRSIQSRYEEEPPARTLPVFPYGGEAG